MKFTTTVLTASLAAFSVAVPTSTLMQRADSCGQWDSVETGSYTVYNNLWGESSASSGSQCFGVDKLNGKTLSWHTTWSWAGGQDSVKSYSNAVVKFTPKPLSAISSIPTTWSWSYTGSNLVADVSYDMFTSSTATGANEYEIMIWLAALGGAGPISSEYGSDGKAVPVSSTTIAGTKWHLYEGPNGDTTVFSFVADTPVKKFEGNLRVFFAHLVQHHGLPVSQYLLSVGAGTEPFTGSNAKLVTSAYSVSVL